MFGQMSDMRWDWVRLFVHNQQFKAVARGLRCWRCLRPLGFKNNSGEENGPGTRQRPPGPLRCPSARAAPAGRRPGPWPGASSPSGSAAEPSQRWLAPRGLSGRVKRGDRERNRTWRSAQGKATENWRQRSCQMWCPDFGGHHSTDGGSENGGGDKQTPGGEH